MNIFVLLISLLLTSCSTNLIKPQLPKEEEKCLSYEPQKVQLKGFLYKKSFPGPPNYQDIKNGDEEEIYWLIKPTTPFCVNANEAVWGSKLSNQSEVQLVFISNINFYKSKRHLLNKNVVITGTLFPQISGHHKTEVLITVETLEKAKE